MTQKKNVNIEDVHLLEEEIQKYLVLLGEIHSENLIKPGERIIIEGDRIKLVSSH